MLSTLTVFLARLTGLFIVLLDAILLFRGSAIIEAAVANQSVMFTYGIISLAMGLAMVLGHNIWSGGLLPVVVTLVGWLILTKGLMLLILIPDGFMRLYAQMQYIEHVYLYLVPSGLIGLYLTWAGFFGAKSQAQRSSSAT